MQLLDIPLLSNPESGQTPAAAMNNAALSPAATGEILPGTAEELLALVYDELRRLAAFRMARQSPGHTLQPTALVHEAWLKLARPADARFKSRAHFFSAAAEAMRHILIDRARRKQARRHGGALERVALEEFEPVSPMPDDQLLAMNEALDRFAKQYPAQAEVVKLRFFTGMTNEETARVLTISVSTVKNHWNFSRAWLFREIGGGD